MSFSGIVIHHSVCPSINGKGYDYYIKKDGLIIPAAEQNDPKFIHICVAGDFSAPCPDSPELKEQLFVLQKLIVRLANRFGFRPDDLFPHTSVCPGDAFPWAQLVILHNDRYH